MLTIALSTLQWSGVSQAIWLMGIELRDPLADLIRTTLDGMSRLHDVARRDSHTTRMAVAHNGNPLRAKRHESGETTIALDNKRFQSSLANLLIVQENGWDSSRVVPVHGEAEVETGQAGIGCGLSQRPAG
jgi:sulfatase maturation enzyme AslB (radical SAM superfamily)